MTAADLIIDIVPPIKPSDQLHRVAERMADFRLNHLPVVQDEQFLGLVSDEDLIEITDDNLTVSSIHWSSVNAFVLENQHIYDVVKLFSELKLTAVPVVDQKRHYLGIITQEAVIEGIARLTSAAEVGGIIVLEISNRNNSLAHMAQIVESDNAQILSSYTRSFPDSTKLEVTLKVNKQDVSAIVATFLRYDYNVKATFNNIMDDHAMDRYDSFMNYLNL